MSDIDSDIRRYYDASYPPSVYTPPVPAPTLTALIPATSIVGQPVTVTLTGTGFTPASVAQADGSPLPTVYVDAETLTVTATPITTGTAQVTVLEGGQVSNAITYTVTGAEGTALTARQKKKGVKWEAVLLVDVYQEDEEADE